MTVNLTPRYSPSGPAMPEASASNARALTIIPTLGTLTGGPAFTTFTVDSGTIPSLAGLAVGDSVAAAMRNDRDAQDYSVVQASVRAANSVSITFLRAVAGTIDVGIVTLDLGIIEAS
jgi:hypothetical protein